MIRFDSKCHVGGIGRLILMKRIITLLLVLGLAVAVQAQEVELRHDHPREYVVQPGDTLWDIASGFLVRPWQWPAIWQANPQIEIRT